MARQLTVGSGSARMCLRAVTDTRAEQEGLGVRGSWGRVGAVQEAEGGGPGPAACGRGASVFPGLGPRTAGLREAWLGLVQSRTNPAGSCPLPPAWLRPPLPRAPGEPRPPAGAAAGTRWHHESPPGRVAGLGEGRGGGGVGDTGQPPRQKEGARSPRVPLNDKPPSHRLPMVTAVSPLALISEPPQPRLRDRQQARACTDLRGPRPFPWPPQRTGSGSYTHWL